MINRYLLILLLGSLFGSSGCNLGSRKTAEALFNVLPDELNGYNLKRPDAKYLLPYVLEEVSGLSYMESGIIACIQDEDGKVYFYDHKERNLLKTIRFAKPGDYEGVEVVGDTIYVVKSNGSLFKFNHKTKEENVQAKEINTALNKRNDIEGLAFDHQLNKLILGCKGSGDIKDKSVNGRAFYEFGIETEKLNKKPVFNITKKGIKNFLESSIDFTYDEKRINFRPSGIALHPIDNLFYIIASTGKLMLITDKQGNIKGSIPLDPRLLGQPEGICFAPNGDLFISSEGQGDKGYILKFAYSH